MLDLNRHRQPTTNIHISQTDRKRKFQNSHTYNLNKQTNLYLFILEKISGAKARNYYLTNNVFCCLFCV